VALASLLVFTIELDVIEQQRRLIGLESAVLPISGLSINMGLEFARSLAVE
jgi:hypothetical protein